MSPESETVGNEVSRIGLDEQLLRDVRDRLDGGDAEVAAERVLPLHPADLADLLHMLDADQRETLVAALGTRLDPETLTYLDDFIRDELLRVLGPKGTGEVLAQLETDDAVDLLADLDEDEKAAILASLSVPDRAILEQGLAYPEHSAGRLMQRELVAVPEYWVVGQTIDYLRATPDLPDDFYDIYITDPKFRPVGSVPLSGILRSKRGVEMKDLKIKELHRIPATMDQEEVAFLFRRYGLVSAPVVDETGQLLGVITVDDVVDVIDEEAEEDLLKLGGVQNTDVFQPPLRTGMQRLPWLVINMFTAIIASLVIAQFEAAIEKVVALAVLMPIVASMAGNAGTQTLTVTVRALAVRELTSTNAMRMVSKELIVSLLNGGVFLVIGIGMALVWFGSLGLALVFGAALLITLLCAGLAGLLIPMAIDRFGLDPAVSSSVFLTTVTDVVGFFAFLGLAGYFLF